MVKAPASLNSPLVSTQYMRCGDSRDHGAGRFTIVRNIYSLPTGGGKSPTGDTAECDGGDLECDSIDLESVGSMSSSDIDILDCYHTHRHACHLQGHHEHNHFNTDFYNRYNI